MSKPTLGSDPVDPRVAASVSATTTAIMAKNLAIAAPFPSYYLETILRGTDWPRKVGRFRKKAIVDAWHVDLTISHQTRFGVALGAGRPELALRLIAADMVNHQFGTWQALLESTEETVEAEVTAAASEGGCTPAGVPDMFDERLPLEAMGASPLAEAMNEVPWNDLFSIQFWMLSFYHGVVWGLVHRENANAAFDRERVHYEERAPEAIESGLPIPAEYPWPTNQDLYDDADWLVADFEQEFGSLGDLPRELEEFAQARGWLRRGPRSEQAPRSTTAQTEPLELKFDCMDRAMNFLRFDGWLTVLETKFGVARE